MLHSMQLAALLFLGVWYNAVPIQAQHNSNATSYNIMSSVQSYESDLVSDATLFELDSAEYQRLLRDRPSELSISIPRSNGQSWTIQLETNDIFSDDFSLMSKGNGQTQPINYTPGLYYRGKIVGEYSTVAISFFDNEIIGIIGHTTGNFVIGAYQPTDAYSATTHIFYNDANLLIQNTIDCHTDDSNILNSVSNTLNAITNNNNVQGFFNSFGNYGPVEIYFEADHQTYLDNNSNTTNVGNFVTGFFNSVATIYNNASIDVVISQLVIWTSNDPYPSSTASAALSSFGAAQQNNFNGDVAHLLSTELAGNGGLAWVDVLCATYDATSGYGPYAYSNIDNTYSNFPTYSWTVMVVTHETGHNIAAPHTHSCAWNGNNTQIDDCGNINDPTNAGACYNASSTIVPATGGTVMSYCHLNAVGINTSAGFHPQVQTLMQNAVLQAACVSSAPYCASSGVTTNDEWIQSFVLDSINNVSGANGGYAFFPTQTTTLSQGSTTPFTITPGYAGSTFPEHFAIWIDYNQDNDFSDAGENVYTSGSTTSAVSGSITVPNNATSGSTRLRVAMKYNAAPDTCENFDFGEVEDYIITIGTAVVPLVVTSSSITQPTCNGNTNGAININVSGGTAPYTYAWSNTATTQNISNLGAGTYSCTITDALGATTTTGNLVISQPPAIVPNVNVSQPACSFNLGAATASPTGGTGGFTYTWSNNQGNVPTITNLAQGSYTVTITDANNCTATQSFTVNAPPAAITSSGIVSNVTCNNGSDGSIDLTVNNAAMPITYSWNNGATIQDPSGLASGAYVVQIIDANGCSATNSFSIAEPSAIVINSSVQDVDCNGNNTGSVSITVNNAVLPITYSWDNGGTTASMSNLTAGNYLVTITDANGCNSTAGATIAQPDVLQFTIAGQNACQGNDGSIVVSPTGGTPPYVITPNNLNNLPVGSYTISVTDANNCPTASQSVQIDGPPTAAFDTSVTERTVIFTNQSMASDNYLWQFGDGSQSVATSPTYTYQSSGDFTVNLIANNVACGTDTATMVITVYLVNTQEVTAGSWMNIHPNPAKDWILFDFTNSPTPAQSWQLTVLDNAGRLVKQEVINNVNNNTHTLDVRALAAGTYFITLQSEDQTMRLVKKVIIQR